MEFKKDKKFEVPEKEFYIDGFKIDEDASRFANGVTTSLNEKELDIRIDLHDFDVKYEVLDNILVIFGNKKSINVAPDTKGGSIPPSEEGRRYKAFVHPILLPPHMNTEKIHSEGKDGIIHIKVPRNGFLEKLREAENCVLCKFRKCLCKFIPELADEILPTLEG